MEPFYICVHVFCETSASALRDAVLGNAVGRLSFAVKIQEATYPEIQKIILQNQLKALVRRQVTLPELNMNPFVEIVKLDWATEYYASDVSLFSHDATHKLWSKTEIANALLEYDNWLASPDAALEKPVNRECEMLRQCVKQANLLLGRETEREEKNVLLPTATPASPSPFLKEPLAKILARFTYPQNEEERAKWVTAREAAEIEMTLDVVSLRKYRMYHRDGTLSEKTADRLAGRDEDGRIWRKAGEHAHTIYLRSSLRNSSGSTVQKSVKTSSRKRG